MVKKSKARYVRPFGIETNLPEKIPMQWEKWLVIVLCLLCWGIFVPVVGAQAPVSSANSDNKQVIEVDIESGANEDREWRRIAEMMNELGQNDQSRRIENSISVETSSHNEPMFTNDTTPFSSYNSNVLDAEKTAERAPWWLDFLTKVIVWLVALLLAGTMAMRSLLTWDEFTCSFDYEPAMNRPVYRSSYGKVQKLFRHRWYMWVALLTGSAAFLLVHLLLGPTRPTVWQELCWLAAYLTLIALSFLGAWYYQKRKDPEMVKLCDELRQIKTKVCEPPPKPQPPTFYNIIGAIKENRAQAVDLVRSHMRPNQN